VWVGNICDPFSVLIHNGVLIHNSVLIHNGVFSFATIGTSTRRRPTWTCGSGCSWRKR
jgi:hypothetical protein